MIRYDVVAAALALSLAMGGPAVAQTANSFDQANSPMVAAPPATAGLNAPPEIPPTANAPAATVKPMASP